MSSAKKKAPPPKVAPENPSRTIRGVRIKGLSISGVTAALGFEVQRDVLDLEDADALLIGARVEVRLSVDAPGQKTLFEEDAAGPVPVEGVADVHRLSVGVETITGRLSFRRQSVELPHLAALTSKEVFLTATRVGDAGADESDDAEADGGRVTSEVAEANLGRAAEEVRKAAPARKATRDYARELIPGATDAELTAWQNQGASGDLPGQELAFVRREIAGRAHGGGKAPLLMPGAVLPGLVAGGK